MIYNYKNVVHNACGVQPKLIHMQHPYHKKAINQVVILQKVDDLVHP